MPPTKKQKVSKKILDNLLERLEALPEKETPVTSVKDLIAQAMPTIENILEKGYTLDDVIKILGGGGVGIKISLSSLKRYMKEAKTDEAPKKSKPEKIVETTIKPSSSNFLEMSDDL
jgi:hypothetical protein